MYLIHHYLQRGIEPEKIINLSAWDREYYTASMLLFFEEEAEKYNVK